MRATELSTEMRAICSRAVVIPAITIERVEDAVPVARALAAGGLTVLEIMLRSAAAIDAVRAIGAIARSGGGAHIGDASATTTPDGSDTSGYAADGGLVLISPFALASRSDAPIPSAPASASWTATEGSFWPDSIADRYE